MTPLRIAFTTHARQRLIERSGLRPSEAAARVRDALTGAVPGYEPSRFPGELWVVCDGPAGRATAIVQRQPGGALVVTVRDSSVIGQGERSGVVLTHAPFASLKR